MAVLLYTYFYNISLNVLRLTFFNIYNLPFYALKISLKFRSKLGQKPITFPIFWAPAPTELQFSIFFSLICSKPRDRQNLVRDFLLSKYFLNNLHLTVFLQPWKLQHEIPFKHIFWSNCHLWNFFWNLWRKANRCSSKKVNIWTPSGYFPWVFVFLDPRPLSLGSNLVGPWPPKYCTTKYNTVI